MHPSCRFTKSGDLGALRLVQLWWEQDFLRSLTPPFPTNAQSLTLPLVHSLTPVLLGFVSIVREGPLGRSKLSLPPRCACAYQPHTY
jgi:hypothetical protein